MLMSYPDCSVSSVHNQLRRLRADANKQITALVGFTRDAEQEHRQKMSAHDGALATVVSDFRTLDKRIAKVATTAVRIGDNLESVDQQVRMNVHACAACVCVFLGHALTTAHS